MSSLMVARVRPAESEHARYYSRYTSLVGEGDVVDLLQQQIDETVALLSEVNDEQANAAYESGKWSIKQVVGHVIDTERIFAYRALRISRNDRTPIEGFDQDPYVQYGPFAHYTLPELLEEFSVVRKSTVMLLAHLDTDAWVRRGIAFGNEVSVRALAYITAGHELHHRNILKERYFRLA